MGTSTARLVDVVAATIVSVVILFRDDGYGIVGTQPRSIMVDAYTFVGGTVGPRPYPHPRPHPRRTVNGFFSFVCPSKEKPAVRTSAWVLHGKDAGTDTDNDDHRDRVSPPPLFFRVGFENIPGSDPDRSGKVNQDAHFSFRLDNNNDDDDDRNDETSEALCVAVLDGHGRNGHHVSSYFATQLPKNMRSQVSSCSSSSLSSSSSFPGESIGSIDDRLLLKRAFESTQQEAINDPSIPSGRSGTTCVACIVRRLEGLLSSPSDFPSVGGVRITVGHVGDSRAILGYDPRKFRLRRVGRKDNEDDDTNDTNDNDDDQDTGRPLRPILLDDHDDSMENDDHDGADDDANDGDGDEVPKWKAVPLTLDTTVACRTERRRIEESDQGRVDSQGNVWFGPIGIAMTRSLGNAVMRGGGVVPTPVLDDFVLEPRVRVTTGSGDGDDDGDGDGDDEGKGKGYQSGGGSASASGILILATDGLTDVFSPEETVTFARDELRKLRLSSQSQGGSVTTADRNYSHHEERNNDPHWMMREVAKSIAHEARRRWQGDLPLEVKADDVTCAVVAWNL